MREKFLSLFTFEQDYFYLKVAIVFIILCKLLSNRQTTQLKFHYNRADRLMTEFIGRTKITQLVYRPYWLSISPFLQAATYIFSEEMNRYWKPEDFDREEIELEDGGTVGIDWARDKGTKVGRPRREPGTKSKPILLLAPGLGGASNNLYTIALVRAARRSGFKVGTMLFRGSDGLPITSGKLSYSGAWEDCKAIVEYAHRRYVSTEKSERMYAYGCSLGAQILALYMIKEGRNACRFLDGAVLYGTPWSTSKGADFFYKNAFGLYQKAIGLNLSENIRKKQLPKMKPYLSEEDYAHYEKALQENWQGMQVLDEHIFPRMFGYASTQDYYDQVTIAERATSIKVPTFALGAEDDQICGHMFAPVKASQSRESNLCLGTTQYGAHVCHMQGHFIPKPWYTKPVMEWFEFLEARNTFSKKYN